MDSCTSEARTTVREPIRNFKDPEVVMIADFAVTEHNKQTNKTLDFVTVVKGEKQLVEGIGINYHLVISAKDEDGDAAPHPKNYEAFIKSRPPPHKLQLHSFTQLPAVPIFGSRMVAIDNLKDSEVVMMAEFAVREHNKQANKTLDFVTIVEGEQQLSEGGMDYELVISAKDGAAALPNNYDALIKSRRYRQDDQLELSIFQERPALPTIFGGWNLIPDLEDQHLANIANLAVTNYNKRANENLEFVTVVEGEYQMVAGIKYRLVISAKIGGATHRKNYDALLWYRAWEDEQLKIISFKEMKG